MAYSVFTAGNSAQAHRLEMEGDRVPLYKHGIRSSTTMPREHNLNQPDEVSRKLNCIAAVRQREGKEDAKAAKVMVRSNFAHSHWWGTRIAAYL